MSDQTSGWVEPSRRQIRRIRRLAARRAAALERVTRQLELNAARDILAESSTALDAEIRRLREELRAARAEERRVRRQLRSADANQLQLSAELAALSAERTALSDAIAGRGDLPPRFATLVTLREQVRTAKDDLQALRDRSSSGSRWFRSGSTGSGDQTTSTVDVLDDETALLAAPVVESGHREIEPPHRNASAQTSAADAAAHPETADSSDSQLEAAVEHALDVTREDAYEETGHTLGSTSTEHTDRSGIDLIDAQLDSSTDHGIDILADAKTHDICDTSGTGEPSDGDITADTADLTVAASSSHDAHDTTVLDESHGDAHLAAQLPDEVDTNTPGSRRAARKAARARKREERDARREQAKAERAAARQAAASAKAAAAAERDATKRNAAEERAASKKAARAAKQVAAAERTARRAETAALKRTEREAAQAARVTAKAQRDEAREADKAAKAAKKQEKHEQRTAERRAKIEARQAKRAERAATRERIRAEKAERRAAARAEKRHAKVDETVEPVTDLLDTGSMITEPLAEPHSEPLTRYQPQHDDSRTEEEVPSTYPTLSYPSSDSDAKDAGRPFEMDHQVAPAERSEAFETPGPDSVSSPRLAVEITGLDEEEIPNADAVADSIADESDLADVSDLADGKDLADGDDLADGGDLAADDEPGSVARDNDTSARATWRARWTQRSAARAELRAAKQEMRQQRADTARAEKAARSEAARLLKEGDNAAKKEKRDAAKLAKEQRKADQRERQVLARAEKTERREAARAAKQLAKDDKAARREQARAERDRLKVEKKAQKELAKQQRRSKNAPTSETTIPGETPTDAVPADTPTTTTTAEPGKDGIADQTTSSVPFPVLEQDLENPGAVSTAPAADANDTASQIFNASQFGSPTAGQTTSVEAHGDVRPTGAEDEPADATTEGTNDVPTADGTAVAPRAATARTEFDIDVVGDVTHTDDVTVTDSTDFSGVDRQRDAKAATSKKRGLRRWVSWIVKKDAAEVTVQLTREQRAEARRAAKEEALARKEAQKEADALRRQEERDAAFEEKQNRKLDKIREKAERNRARDDQKRADRAERDAAKARAEEIKRNVKARQEQEQRERREERERRKADRHAENLTTSGDAQPSVQPAVTPEDLYGAASGDVTEFGSEQVVERRSLLGSLRQRAETRRRLRQRLLDTRTDNAARAGDDKSVLSAEERKVLREQLKDERRRITEARRAQQESERQERRERRAAEKADRRATQAQTKAVEAERERLVRSFKNTRAEEKARRKEAAESLKAEQRRIKELRKAEAAQKKNDQRAAKKSLSQEKKYRKEVRRQQKKKANQQRRLLREETKIARRASRIALPEIAITRDEPVIGSSYNWDAESGIYNAMGAGSSIDHTTFDLPEPLPRR